MPVILSAAENLIPMLSSSPALSFRVNLFTLTNRKVQDEPLGRGTQVEDNLVLPFVY